ncbi:MAG: iron ABC transporter permease [Thermoleophilaceae bacterium]|nr:iron ABC transporter permease [Thermoleophilaceae bacterium]
MSDRRPPWVLSTLGVAAVGLVCLPLAYLVVRVAGAGPDAWSVLERPRTWLLIAKTVALVTAVTAGAVLVGVPAAFLVTRTDLPARRFWAVALALPLVLPSYVLALALLAVSGPGGLLGLPALEGFSGALLALVLATYPFVFLLCVAALRRTDPALEETARGLGRRPGQVFREVTLPLLRPAIGAGALLVALYTLADFGVVSLMRAEALTQAVYLQYRGAFDREPAAVLALVLVGLTVLVLVAEQRARARIPVAPSGGRTVRSAALVPLGRMRVPALAFCGAVAGMGLVLPVCVLVLWLMRRTPSLEGVAAATLNSLLVAVAAAALTTLAALPVAVLAARYRRGWTLALERVGYGANALPGIVAALAFVFFAARHAPVVYQSLALLVTAYIVRFFPQALAGTSAALARAEPRLEEASRGLGRGPTHTLATVTVPVVAPGLLAGATLVLLSTLKELPATLVLRPIGFDTLATEVWTATSVSQYSQAAVPALLLCALAAPAVWLLVVRGSRELGRLGN